MRPDDELFARALDLPAAERAEFLARECAGDAAQRERLEALLRGFVKADAVLPAPFVTPPPGEAGEKPGDAIGRYKLLEKIGEGGCGVVYLAEQCEPVRRRVALKVIKLGMDTKAVVARFEAERQALAMMDHPNIAKVLDAGATANGRPFFVMELVQGVAITKFCDEHQLTPAQRLELFILVCGAIQHAHQKGIVHRDLKPSNILVALHDGAPAPKVIDFGIAKATQGRLTEHTLFTAVENFIGTPVYMSPEQAAANGAEVDARSDLYSLGVLLYELLTGRPPFDPAALTQHGVDEIRRRICELEPPRPSTRWRTLSEADRTTVARSRGAAPAEISLLLRGDLDWIVMRCLEKSAARRYESASALAADLRRHLRHEPVAARAPGVAYRAGKFLRRRRAALASTAAVVLALASVARWSAWRTERALASRRPEQVAAPAPAAIDPESIAVLPFENRSAEKDASAFFVEGIHEDVVNRLAHLRGLRVVARTSVMEYRGTTKKVPQIARELGVAYVLEGSVQRAGGRVRVSGQLIHAPTEKPVWAQSYERELGDIFALQSELAQAIAAELRATITPEEKRFLERRPTENPAAYDLFLRARQRKFDYAMSDGNRQEIAWLEEAVRLDPKFAAAWADLSQLCGLAYVADRTAAWQARAQQALEATARLDPGSKEYLYALANYSYRVLGDLARAEAQFKQLVALAPDDPWALTGLGVVQARRGDLTALQRACELEPKNRGWLVNYIDWLASWRRYDEAAEAQRQLCALGPEAVHGYNLAKLTFFSRGTPGEVEQWLARDGAGLPAAQRLFLQRNWAFLRGELDAFDARADAAPPGGMPWRFSGLIGLPPIQRALRPAAAGDVATARALLTPFVTGLRTAIERQPTNEVLWSLLGVAEALAGNKEEALRAADRAVQLRPESLDRFYGMQAVAHRAFVCAWVGEKERALADLARLLRTTPCGRILNVHVMRRCLEWKPLQDDPRFEALLDEPVNNAPIPADGAAVRPAPPADARSIAVLPFANLSAEEDNAFFAAGVHEDVLTSLSHLHELRVVSRTSVMEYAQTTKKIPQIARELGVAYVLEGSVRRAGGRVRVTAKLIRAETERQVWAETFERDARDHFAIQAELGQKIAEALHAVVSPGEKKLLAQRPTENAEAYDLFLKARAELRRGARHDRAAALLEAAVALDPSFALAWAELAVEQADVYMFGYNQSAAQLAAARASMERALQRAPDHPEVRRAQAEFYFRADADYARCLELYRRLAADYPNDPEIWANMGYAQRRQGNWRAALANFRRAHELDPGNMRIAGFGLGATLIALRHYPEIIARCDAWLAGRNDMVEPIRLQRARTMFLASGSTRPLEELAAQAGDPRAGPEFRRGLAQLQGRYEEVVRIDDVVGPGKEPNAAMHQALAFAAAGDLERARTTVAPFPPEIRRRLEREPANGLLRAQLAAIEAILGHGEEALRCANACVEGAPRERDVVMHAFMRTRRAMVNAWVGNTEAALAEYAELLRSPDYPLNVHEMRRMPEFLPLQHAPRFLALLNDPANNAPFLPEEMRR